MWNRKELKQRAKAAFKKNYWLSVAAGLITCIAVAGLSVTLGQNTGEATELVTSESFAMTLTAAFGGLSVIVFLVNLFVLKPLEIGGKKFFLENAEGRADFNNVLGGFKNNYMDNVLTMFLRGLFTALWTLLFIIPGIVKMYAYRMVPYILAEHPEMKGTEALKASEAMMKGHKWNAFVLDLSFIGWVILSILTLGLVTLFYANPYYYATDAELYRAIKAEREDGMIAA